MKRDEFYKEAWDFVQENKHLSEEGIRELGCSCDWSRNIFTLDERIVKIVYETFEKMHKDDLIYRGDRISNWCTKHQTVLSELECNYEERSDSLYYMKYGPLELATVRPETKFGDTGVAVNPNDKRYTQYVGKEIEIETLLGTRKIKVIADEAVDPEFGTGVVKVTPAHDAADFDIWERHKDEIPGPNPVIDKHGRMNDKAGPYAGMKVAEAREKIVQDMQAKGLITKIEPNYIHNVSVCYKCGTVIEPLIVPQWYVAMTKSLPDGRPSLRDMAVDAVKSGEVSFVSKRFENQFMRWMENIRDWPISRQIWWGIPIPAWYHELKCIPRPGS
jgi:valyl-tRNA synthetase